jgi:hypothetical protein
MDPVGLETLTAASEYGADTEAMFGEWAFAGPDDLGESTDTYLAQLIAKSLASGHSAQRAAKLADEARVVLSLRAEWLEGNTGLSFGQWATRCFEFSMSIRPGESQGDCLEDQGSPSD